jgi:threonylcarbamoyladenosine tRNA methylthiotransferase MtaB
MNRRYDTSSYEEKCNIIRKYYEHPAITTDVIVGFPGETDEEFEQTKEFLRRIHFYEMHIFKYSKRKGTKAAVMPDQVPEEQKAQRSAVLLAMAQEMSEEYRSYYLGKTEQALFEEEVEINGEKYFTGYTKEYVKLAVKTDKNLENQFLTGTVTEHLNGEIYLMVEF